nr:tape measure protein [Endozoicomonas sp.]
MGLIKKSRIQVSVKNFSMLADTQAGVKDMASNNTVLNIVIRARDLAKGALTKVTTRLRTMGRASQKTEKNFASLGRRIRNLVMTSLGFYAMKKAMLGVVETGDQFARLQLQMNAIMGSIEEGEKAVEWIKQFTRDTPLQLHEVTETFAMLKNFGLDPMDGSLQAIVDTNSRLGGTFEKLRRISLALGQAWGKQKLQGEEIRQLVEAGVPVWGTMSCCRTIRKSMSKSKRPARLQSRHSKTPPMQWNRSAAPRPAPNWPSLAWHWLKHYGQAPCHRKNTMKPPKPAARNFRS